MLPIFKMADKNANFKKLNLACLQLFQFEKVSTHAPVFKIADKNAKFLN